MTHNYSDETRHRLFDKINYLEATHDIAAVPHEFNPKFYPSEAELRWAKALKGTMSGKMVVWGVNGSSVHKVYPWTQIVAKWLAERGFHVVLTGDAVQGKEFQNAILDALKKTDIDMAYLHPMAGELTIRQTLTLAQVADCVVGPETGLLNAVAHENVPKVIMLSHSTADNLTKHWKNVTVLSADRAKVGCSGCHRLHYDWTYCPQDEETNAALCASAIKPSLIMDAILSYIATKKKPLAA